MPRAACDFDYETGILEERRIIDEMGEVYGSSVIIPLVPRRYSAIEDVSRPLPHISRKLHDRSCTAVVQERFRSKIRMVIPQNIQAKLCILFQVYREEAPSLPVAATATSPADASSSIVDDKSSVPS